MVKFFLISCSAIIVVFVAERLIKIFLNRNINKAINSNECVELENEKYGVVSTLNSTVNITDLEKHNYHFNINQIKKITGFKKDLYTTDLICFLIETNDQHVIIHEEMKGFKSFTELLIEKYQYLKPDWFTKIAFPAFELNEHILYAEQ